jgi:hypothetical protein
MDTLQPRGASLDKLAYFARVTTRDGRAIEEAMAGATLLDTGARLEGLSDEVCVVVVTRSRCRDAVAA